MTMHSIIFFNAITFAEIMTVRYLYLLTGQLFSEFGLFLLHAAQFFLLALEAKLHLQRFAAIRLHW